MRILRILCEYRKPYQPNFVKDQLYRGYFVSSDYIYILPKKTLSPKAYLSTEFSHFIMP